MAQVSLHQIQKMSSLKSIDSEVRSSKLAWLGLTPEKDDLHILPKRSGIKCLYHFVVFLPLDVIFSRRYERSHKHKHSFIIWGGVKVKTCYYHIITRFGGNNIHKSQQRRSIPTSNQDLLSSPAPAVPVPGPAATSLVSKMWFVSSYGGFHKWWYPNSWMVYNGKSENKMDDLGVPPFQETSRCVFINVYVLTVHKSCPTKTRFNGQRAMALMISLAACCYTLRYAQGFSETWAGESKDFSWILSKITLFNLNYQRSLFSWVVRVAPKQPLLHWTYSP